MESKKQSYEEESVEFGIKVHSKLKERAKEQHRGRTEAVLELKANTEKAFADLCGKNNKRHAEAVALAESQAREFEELLAAGKNPYQVFRSREIEKRSEKKIAFQKRKIKAAEMNIAAHMVQEATLNQKRDEADQRPAAYVQKYQKELGRKVVEDRTRDYMISRTGKELVDPTGHTFRIDPSQVTVMKDHSFGLGKSSVKSREQRNKVIDMIAAKPEHANVQINPRGLPKVKEKQPSNQLSEPETLLLPPIVDPPGKDMSKIHGVGQKSNKTSTQLPSITQDISMKKGFGKPKRSKLEESMRLKALEKQKENLIEKQIVWRKEFVGKAFLADPDILWFKDFDIEKPQTLRFTLTNASNTFNHFKLLPLQDDIRDFFDVKYELPGRMSAGMTCSIQVTFCAKMNQDIITEIPAVAKTGYFSIPVKCTAKRAVPILSSSNVLFTNVVVGEVSKQTIVLHNNGALSTNFHVIPIDNSATTMFDNMKSADEESVQVESNSGDSSAHSTEESLLNYATSFGQHSLDKAQQTTIVSTNGFADAYSTCSIVFTFSPHQPVQGMRQTFQVVFDSPGNVDPIDINVEAHSVQVPLYVESPLMDFKCCVYGKLYRNKLVLRNRGKVAMKCQLKVPSYLSESIEFLPNFGYVQGSVQNEATVEPGRFEIQIKFRPAEKIWTKILKKRFGFQKGDVIAVPLQVLVPDQVLPVYFVLRAQLTPGDLEFSFQSLDFGPCYTSQSVVKTLVITNPSRLPQKFGFIHVPTELRVEPNDGFGTLLSHEKIQIQIYYSPQSAVELKTNLTCSTTMNRSFNNPCEGRGLTPPLRFSDTVITLGAIPLGQYIVHNVICTNTTSEEQKMEIEIPQEIAKVLHIRPLVASFEPYSSSRIEIEFRPTSVDIFETISSNPAVIIIPSCREAISALKYVGQHEHATNHETTWSYDIPAEPPSYHGTFNLVCFVSGNATQASMSLQLNATIIEPEFTPKPERIEFGQVSVGQTSVLKLQLINHSPVELDTKAMPLHCVGPFSIVNALRPIAANGGIKTIIVEFSPSAPLIYQEDLIILTSRGKMCITLRGEGVSPVLKIQPQDGKINFKPVLSREKGFTEFTLLNSSQFQLKYHIKPIENESYANFNQTSVFTCIPSEASIPPGGTQVIRAIFSPDHERPKEYVTTFRVDVPNQTEDHLITLRGRCWECQSYIFSPPTKIEDLNEDIYELPLHITTPSVLTDMLRKANRIIQVQFENETEIKQIFIGSIGPQNEDGHQTSSFLDGKSSTPLNYEITFESNNGMNLSEKYRKYSTIEPQKGIVNPGHEIPISIHFNSNIDQENGNQLRILHWIRFTGKITLKGGYIPLILGIQEQIIELVLKARVFT